MNAFWFEISLINITASFVLLAGMLDDFLTRKVHNWLILSTFAIAIVTSLYAPENWSAFLQIHALGFLAAIALTLPLVWIGWLGSGDMKLLAVFGWIAGTHPTLNVIGLAFLWAAIWGLVLVAVSGNSRIYLTNIKNILIFRKSSSLKLQAMPFTAPIFLGWLSYLRLESLHLTLF